MITHAEQIVSALLEVEDQNAHVKAHGRVQKWDKAHATFQDLLKLKQQAVQKYKQVGRAISYERELARVGVNKADVSSQIYGAQVGSIDNYKQTRPVHQCANLHCANRRPYPVTTERCPDCAEPLQTRQMRYAFTDLHGKLANHILGVELNDGTRVWFDEPVPPYVE